MTVDFNIINQKGSPAIFSDTYANRPAASYPGRLFISTDTKEIYRDTGSAWEEIAGSGSGNIQGSGTANYVPKFTDTETIGNSQIRDDGTGVGIGVAPSAVYKLDISGSQRNTLSAAGGLSIVQSGTSEASYGVYNSSSGAAFLFEKFDDATATFTDSGIYALGGFYTKVSDGSSNFYNSFFDNGNVGIGVVVDSGYKLSVNGTGRFVNGVNMATTSGNVGIGTTNPSQKLHVYTAGGGTSTYALIENAGTTVNDDIAALIVKGGATNAYWFLGTNRADIGGAAANFFLYNGTTANKAMVVTPTGNVGIGTSSPDELLTLSANVPVLKLTSTNATGKSYQFFSNSDGNFYLRNATTSTNLMVITNSGNVTSFSGAVEIGNTVAVSVATPSTHKVTMLIGGVTYYLLASNV